VRVKVGRRKFNSSGRIVGDFIGGRAEWNREEQEDAKTKTMAKEGAGAGAG